MCLTLIKSLEEIYDESFCVFNFYFVEILQGLLLRDFEAVSEASQIFVNPFANFKVKTTTPCYLPHKPHLNSSDSKPAKRKLLSQSRPNRVTGNHE